MTADEQLADLVAERVRMARVYMQDGSLRLAATCFQFASQLCLERDAEIQREFDVLIHNLNGVER